MRMEVANICMDKEVDSVTVNTNNLSGDPTNDTTSFNGSTESDVSINGDSKPDTETPDEVKEIEVEKCIIEVSGHTKDNLDCETCLVDEKTKTTTKQTEGESKKSNATVKPSTKSAVGHAKTKHTVPQPFALATEKRAQCGTRPVGNPVAKSSHSTRPAQVTKKTKEVI